MLLTNSGTDAGSDKVGLVATRVLKHSSIFPAWTPRKKVSSCFWTAAGGGFALGFLGRSCGIRVETLGRFVTPVLLVGADQSVVRGVSSKGRIRSLFMGLLFLVDQPHLAGSELHVQKRFFVLGTQGVALSYFLRDLYWCSI